MVEDIHGRLRAVMARLLGSPVDQLPAELKMGDHPRWDSMGHMDLVAALEKEFGVRFPSHALPRITSISAIEKELAKLLHRA